MERNLKLFTPFYCLKAAGIYVVYLVPFMQALFLSEPRALALIAVTFWIAGILEIPTGYFADGVGRRFSLIGGAIAAIAGSVMYAITTGETWQLVLAAVLYGVANSLLSGADNAMVYETYCALGTEEKAHKADRRLRGWAGGSEAFFTLLGILVYWLLGYRGIMWAQVLLWVAVLVIAILLREPQHAAKKSQVHIGFATIIRRNLCNRQRIVVLLLAGFVANLSAALVWWTPVYYQYATGFSIGGDWGWVYNVIWAGFLGSIKLFGWIGDSFHERLENHRRTSLWFFIALAACSYTLVILGTGFIGVIAIVGTYVVRAIAIPLATQIINERVDARERATSQSISRTLQLIVSASVLAFSGWVADVTGSIPVGIAVSGVIVIGGAVFLLLTASRLRQVERPSARA